MPVFYYIHVVTWRVIGGGRNTVVVENLLNRTQPDFGGSITEIAVELYKRAPSAMGRPIEAGEKIYTQDLSKLPRRRFEAKKRRYTIIAVSRLPGNEDDWTSTADPLDDRASLEETFEDVVAVLQANPPKLKQNDFDWVRFVAWFRSLKSELPETPAAIDAAVHAGANASKARLAAMDPWARLDINWKTFHRDARKLLPDPWFWDQVDEFAPHGNDSGADVLPWLRRRKKGADFTPTLYDRLIADFDYDPAVDPDSLEDHQQQDYFDLVVGIAFAHLKLQGFCPLWLREKALATMSIEAKLAMSDHAAWEHKDAKLAALERLTTALNACPTSAP
jgi:uncharacterized protein YfeS